LHHRADDQREQEGAAGAARATQDGAESDRQGDRQPRGRGAQRGARRPRDLEQSLRERQQGEPSHRQQRVEHASQRAVSQRIARRCPNQARSEQRDARPVGARFESAESQRQAGQNQSREAGDDDALAGGERAAGGDLRRLC
jgi:hypothetical protein